MTERTPIDPSEASWLHAIYFWSLYLTAVAPKYVRKSIQNMAIQTQITRQGRTASESQVRYFTSRYRQNHNKALAQPINSPADFTASRIELKKTHREFQAIGVELTRNAARNSLKRLLRKK